MGPLCDGQPAYWIAGTADGSDVSLAEKPLRQAIVQSVEAVRGFRVSRDLQRVRVKARAIGAGGPHLAHTTLEGDVFGENDDFEQTVSSRITSNLGPGDCCVCLRSAGSVAMTSTLQIARDDQPEPLHENGDHQNRNCPCISQMTSIASSEKPLDEAGADVKLDISGNEAQQIRLSLSDPLALSLTAESRELDPEMSLFDENGIQIATNDDSDGGRDGRQRFPDTLPVGDHCIGISPVNSGAGTTTVTAATFDATAFRKQSYRRAEASPPLVGSISVEVIDVTTESEMVTLLGEDAHWLGFQTETRAATFSLSAADRRRLTRYCGCLMSGAI